MEIDKFLGMDCDLLYMGGYDFQKLAPQWERPFNMRNYDRVVMTADELNKMLEASCEKDEFGSELLKYPALQEFVLFVREPDWKMGTIICFRKTIMKHEIVDDQGAVCITYKPCIDAYIHFLGSPAPLDMVVTLVNATLIKDDMQTINMTVSQQMWLAVDCPVYQDAVTDEQTFVEFVRNIKLAYMTMQYCFKHRPVLFREITEKRPQMTEVSHGKKKKHRNKVRAVKVITIVPEELEAISATVSHEITCPCWGVMGHWRTYKTGKKIWIKPYKKGKERNKEAAYRPKEYEDCKEAEQHE